MLRPAGHKGVFVQVSQGLAKSTETKQTSRPCPDAPGKRRRDSSPCLLPRVQNTSHSKVNRPAHCKVLEEIVQWTTVFLLGRVVLWLLTGQTDLVMKNYEFRCIACSNFSNSLLRGHRLRALSRQTHTQAAPLPFFPYLTFLHVLGIFVCAAIVYLLPPERTLLKDADLVLFSLSPV